MEKLTQAWIDESIDHPNEEIVLSGAGYVEIGGYSGSKRRALAEKIRDMLEEFNRANSPA